jgi:hypothetical protein
MDVDSLRVGDEHDKRRKLSSKDYEDIKYLYQHGFSPTALADKYNVSRTYIHCIVNKELYKRQKSRTSNYMKENRKANAVKNKSYLKTHREYKKRLFEEGTISL